MIFGKHYDTTLDAMKGFSEVSNFICGLPQEFREEVVELISRRQHSKASAEVVGGVGHDFETGYDMTYLAQILNISGAVTIEQKTSDPNGTDIRYVIFPMKEQFKRSTYFGRMLITDKGNKTQTVHHFDCTPRTTNVSTVIDKIRVTKDDTTSYLPNRSATVKIDYDADKKLSITGPGKAYKTTFRDTAREVIL